LLTQPVGAVANQDLGVRHAVLLQDPQPILQMLEARLAANFFFFIGSMKERKA
jgi:hypothetical protein